MTAHTQLRDNIISAFGKRDDVRLFSNPIGFATNKTGAKYRFGLPAGTADIIGLVTRRIEITPDEYGIILIAQFVAIEVKCGRDKLSPKQERFLKTVLSLGGCAGEARSVDEAMRIIDEWNASN